MFKKCAVICGMLGVALGLLGVVNVMARDKQEKPRFEIKQVVDKNEAGIYVIDREKGETTSIYSGGRLGSFVAFYRNDIGRGMDLLGRPRLALSADGIQVVGKDGKMRFLDIEKLSRLADLQLPDLPPEDERPVPPISDEEAAAQSCDEFNGVLVNRIAFHLTDEDQKLVVSKNGELMTPAETNAFALKLNSGNVWYPGGGK